MLDDWTPDLDARSGPIYEALMDALRRDIHSERLSAGARLPTYRGLAQALGVSLGTVTKAYAEARKIGLITGEAGRGMFVAKPKSVAEEGYPSITESSGYVDLTLNQPAIDYRSDLFRKCLADLSQRNNLMRLLEYNLTPGKEAYRKAASAWIRFCGLEVPSENVLLCNGAQQALFACLTVYVKPGEAVATETINYPGLGRMAGMAGVRLLGVALDDHGMIPESLDEVCRNNDVRLIVCTPRGHNPTTACIPIERRQRILEIADRHGIRVVEDDVYGALYGTTGTPTLYELSGGRTIYINSLSKCFAPGMRMGFLVAESAALSQLMEPIYNTTWCVPGIVGEIFTHWMSHGKIKAVLQWHRREIRKRQLMTHWIFKDYTYKASRGCYHIWLDLPPHLKVEQLVINARQVGLLLTHGSVFSVAGEAAPNSLRLSLGTLATIGSLRNALKLVEELMSARTVSHQLVI